MSLVSIDQLALGMVLSRDVRDMTSRLLLSKGLHIEARHIRLLKMWGIFEVHVHGTDAPAETIPETADPERLEAVGKEVVRLFGNLDLENPAIKEILKLSAAYRMTKPGGEPRARKRRMEKEEIPPMPAENPLAGMERMEIKLPEVPALVFQLNEIIADPMSSAADIGRLVNQSPSLAAMLLKIVNSAFYGFRSKIDSISRAVVLIGSKEVSNLALGITIMETFKDIPKQVMNVESFMAHNLACGIVARILAAHSSITATEQIFASGMLHDIGRLVLCKHFPDVAQAVFANARRTGDSLLKSERAMTGNTHAQLGQQLIKKWKLPWTLENNIHYHHNPSASPDPESAVIVQMADIITHALDIGASGEDRLPGFDGDAWQRIKLPAGALASIFHQATHQIENFRNAFA